MKLFRSFMGRRQFLMGAAATSALGLAGRKAAGLFGRDSVAAASDLSPGVAKAAEKGSGAQRYPNLLAPLKIGNKIVKNRMIHTVGSPPHFMQGPETYPGDVLRTFYSNVARGAGIVLCPTALGTGGGEPQIGRREGIGDSIHMSSYDTTDPAVQNYIAQVIEGVHSMGSLVTAGSLRGVSDVVTVAKQLEDQGVDVLTLSAGDVNDPKAVEATMKQMEAVRQATDLIITVYQTVRHPLLRPETSDSLTILCPTLEEAVKTARTFEEYIDIFQLRPATAIGMHPTGWNQEDVTPQVLYLCKAIRESGAKVLLAPNAGFQDLALNEEYIATGQCDMITMARTWHADPEYGLKAYEGRGEDVVPCILCDRCHGPGFDGPWYAACSVNPKLGIESTLKAIYPPTAPKTVAVIGGGPGGMKAAVTAAERGHSVTLYEKNGELGGLIRHSDYSPYKWPLKKYKDWLIRMVEKAGVQVMLNTEATPDMIQAKGYDAVVAALGAAPYMTRLPGSDAENVYDVLEVYEKEKELGNEVVFIGAGEYGVETAMFLAKAGHKTTILTSSNKLLEVERVHYPEYIVDTYDYLDNFYYHQEVMPKRISNGTVIYTDASGREKSIKADAVVIYSGLKARKDEALAFYGSAVNAFYTVGDCTGRGGDLQKVTRSAYFAAAQI